MWGHINVCFVHLLIYIEKFSSAKNVRNLPPNAMKKCNCKALEMNDVLTPKWIKIFISSLGLFTEFMSGLVTTFSPHYLRERERVRERERERGREWEREGESERERGREWEREKESVWVREGESERVRKRGREWEREGESERVWERERERERVREREKEREGERERQRKREGEWESERDSCLLLVWLVL